MREGLGGTLARRALAALLTLVLISGASARGEAALTRFYLSRGGYMVPRSWEVTLGEDGCTLAENEGEARPLSPALAGELAGIVRDCGLAAWNGFRESDPNVLDGEGFWLELAFSDGESVFASGQNAFPEGYYAAMDRLEELFAREKRSYLAGDYRYAGEGPGDACAITLRADATCELFPGALEGVWEEHFDLVDVEIPDQELRLSFGLEGGALVYLEDMSDPFPVGRVAEGERFVRPEEEEESMKLRISGVQVPVTWEENASVAALRELLPLTVSMSMYGGFEQVGSIGRSLPREDRQTVTAAGDIVLYAGDQIVVFYGSNSWAYTRLGHVDLSPEEMAELLSHGDVEITIE